MASLEEIRSARLTKVDILRSKGIDPYPARVPRDFSIAVLKCDFQKYVQQSKKEDTSKKEQVLFSIAGRIMAIRGQGAILFVVLFDGTEKFQVIIKKDILEKSALGNASGQSNQPEALPRAGTDFQLFTDTVDIGDFISITGEAILSDRGEPSILAHLWTMAGKSLLPLPEKWAGLQDVEERYRKRYLDLLMNSELRELIVKKSKFWDVTRSFLKERGFLEVETPTLETTTGGAEAEPFKTHHNDYDLDVFLRISVGELWQKRLMAGGFDKTFEIGRVYRNEGTSPEHAQEFTNMEFYWSFADYRDGMKLVKEMYITIAREVFGRTEFTSHGHTFDLAHEWAEIKYSDEIKNQTGVDIEYATENEIIEKLKNLGVKYDGTNRERLTDTLWKFCRKNISGPAFLVDHPVLVAPLAKSILGENKVQMFQPIFAGSEIGRGYSELNDPIDQKSRFEAQQKLLENGDTEAMMSDFEFIEMLEHGMPPTCGFGFGERMFAILVDKPLRDLQLFPLMRPKVE